MTVIWFVGQIVEFLCLYSATRLVGYRLRRRAYFMIRFSLSILLLSGCKILLDGFFVQGKKLTDTLIINWVLTIYVLLIAIVYVYICYQCNVQTAVFCGTVGYCMFQVMLRLAWLADIFFTNYSGIVLNLLRLVISILFYAFLFFSLIRKSRQAQIIVDRKIQIIVISFVISALDLLQVAMFTQLSYVMDMRGKLVITSQSLVYIYSLLFSIIIGLMAIIIEYAVVNLKNAESEKEIINRLREEEKVQYCFEKDIIDRLNVKCHDLKHWIDTLEKQASPEMIKELTLITEEYDQIFRTGNDVLDVIMTKKNLLCIQKNIKLICIANGEALKFVSVSDIYSLFGNILDNAIEASEKIEDIEKRIIDLHVELRGGVILISAFNFYTENLHLDLEGLPLTTKADPTYHGFGMKSIHMIVQKYNGDWKFTTENGVFMLNIMIPIP